MKNVHPVYHVKTLMIKRELAKDPTLAQEDWSRFLPKFKKKNTSSRRKPAVVREKKQYTPFPPAQPPSKIDLQIESGEYFLQEAQREEARRAKKKAVSKERAQCRQAERAAEFRPPEEDRYGRIVNTAGDDDYDNSIEDGYNGDEVDDGRRGGKLSKRKSNGDKRSKGERNSKPRKL